MSQLWLVPADEESYQKTLAEPRDLTPAPNRPQTFPERARVWGFRTDRTHPDGPFERHERNLKRAQPGDPLLIYRNERGRYVAGGRMGGPFWHTEWVRDELWNGGPALDIFHVTEWKEIDLRPAVVNRLLGYKQRYVPQGLSRVADDRPTDRLLERVGIE